MVINFSTSYDWEGNPTGSQCYTYSVNCLQELSYGSWGEYRISKVKCVRR